MRGVLIGVMNGDAGGYVAAVAMNDGVIYAHYEHRESIGSASRGDSVHFKVAGKKLMCCPRSLAVSFVGDSPRVVSIEGRFKVIPNVTRAQIVTSNTALGTFSSVVGVVISTIVTDVDITASIMFDEGSILPVLIKRRGEFASGDVISRTAWAVGLVPRICDDGGIRYESWDKDTDLCGIGGLMNITTVVKDGLSEIINRFSLLTPYGRLRLDPRFPWRCISDALEEHECVPDVFCCEVLDVQGQGLTLSRFLSGHPEECKLVGSRLRPEPELGKICVLTLLSLAQRSYAFREMSREESDLYAKYVGMY
jgi:hypothetical protein